MPHLALLQDALWEERRLVLHYEHGGRPPARRWLLDPWGLVSKNGVWYLVAAAGGDPRMFRVSRVRGAETTPEPSRCPADLDLAAVWARLQADVERLWGPLLAVRFAVRAEHAEVVVRVCAPQVVGEVREEPCTTAGWRGFSADFRAAGAARGVLLGFGADVRVLEPPELVADVLATARSVLASYGAGPS
ncbi:WYL domain-containing protein [Kineococcus glutinatus]|uniref:WYL domain-containing protein n=1 Tax=Kineococcus glutinatus TaxID=1070872 RepID=A0ABP9I3K7_9ACTN